MAAYLPIEQQACSGDVVEQMLGGAPSAYPARYRQSSASAMLPLGIKQTIVWGARDRVVPKALGAAYAAKARRSGDRVDLLSFPDAGHFEIASPLEQSWPELRLKIVQALAPTRAKRRH